MSCKKEKWWKFQEYIADKLKEVDPYARSTKASGGSTELYDIKTSVDLAFECKQRETKSVTVNEGFWKKLCNEIPLHSKKIPVLALQNKDEKKWAVVDLDDFLDIYIKLYKIENDL